MNACLFYFPLHLCTGFNVCDCIDVAMETEARRKSVGFSAHWNKDISWVRHDSTVLIPAQVYHCESEASLTCMVNSRLARGCYMVRHCPKTKQRFKILSPFTKKLLSLDCQNYSCYQKRLHYKKTSLLPIQTRTTLECINLIYGSISQVLTAQTSPWHQQGSPWYLLANYNLYMAHGNDPSILKNYVLDLKMDHKDKTKIKLVGTSEHSSGLDFSHWHKASLLGKTVVISSIT